MDFFFNSPYFAEHLKDVSTDDFEKRHGQIVNGVIEQINRMLRFGGHKLRALDGKFDVVKIKETSHIQAPELKHIDRDYVRMISSRALSDVNNGRLDSALTQARTLLEEVFVYAIEKKHFTPIKSGNISELFSQVKDLYNMHASKEADKQINMLISGLNKVVDAIALMRNKDSDAHGLGSQRLIINDYHARLAVNAATTVAEFMISVVIANKSQSS